MQYATGSPEPESGTISGIVERVFFANPASPAMAGVMRTADGEEVRFAGKCYAKEGDKLEVTGEWGRHPKFGAQFQVATGAVKMDDSPEALAHLLATDDRFPDIGPVRARKIVDAAVQLCEGDLGAALTQYAGEIAARAKCPVEAIETAARAWNEKRSYFESLAHLVGQGWSNAQAQTIVHRFGEGAPALIRADPYMLIGKIPRFGFKTVDAVARRIGFSSTDPLRLAAGITYCLDQIGSNGSTWTTRVGLVSLAMGELQPDTLDGERKIAATLEELIERGFVHVDESPTGQEVVADARMAAVEFEVFGSLVRGLGDASLPPLDYSGERAMAVLPSLNDGQRRAFLGALTHAVSVISGGAGVGKTYTMRAICEVAAENAIVVALAAPTGKAARRLAASTGRRAQTIHKLLEPIFDERLGTFAFSRGPHYPLEVGLVVVDEVSMVDVRLMRSLLRALPAGCRLLLVGDHNQIPSVSPGAILRDLLAARTRYPRAVHVLDEVVRQAGELARNTTTLLRGVISPHDCPAWRVERCERGSEHGLAGWVATMVEAMVTMPDPMPPFDRQLDLAWDVQVLAPQRKHTLGTYELNVEIQKVRQRLLGNPPPPETRRGDRPKPLIGDRVIFTRNDYNLDLMNGTQAIVTGFPRGGAMQVRTEDGRDVTIPSESRFHVEVAYAMTIHKSQGSEWPCVILCAASSHHYMHDRNLLYTGASRAATALTIFGDWQGMTHFAQQRKSESRQTFGSFLVHGWQPRAASDSRSWEVAAEVDGMVDEHALIDG